MKRILFICHGNICRSPMAEFVMKDMVAQVGREDEFYIESAATSTEEIGNDMYPPVKHCLSKHGVPFTRRTARQITRDDYRRFDLILCMDQHNIRNLRYTLGVDLLTADAALPDPKIRMLLSRDVADPWYTGNFEATYKDVVEGCNTLIMNKKNDKEIL